MTEKNRNNFYDDQDLKTPGHDKIMDHLIDDTMLSIIANTLHLGFKDSRGIRRGFICDTDDTWNKIEEFPIKIGYNFRYIDLCATVEKKFHYSGDGCNFRCGFSSENDKPLCSNELNEQGFFDISSECRECSYESNSKECTLYASEKYNETKSLKMNIEVKTTIPSIGELIRQINTYRELNNGYYIVITPNTNESLKNRLNNANITLIDTKQLDIII